MPENSISDFANSPDYLMESEDEATRLEVKTDPVALRRQALWCGIKPGMRVLDAGCGVGKTTSLLYEMIQPEGSIVGIDFSEARIKYAEEHYGGKKGIEFFRQDLTGSLTGLGEFDLIWVRFILEYFRRESPDIVRNLKKNLKPGGILCLIDLDYNCLSHYELPQRMAELLTKMMALMDEKYNFDTFAGRKLYSYMYDNGFEKIEMNMEAHHLIYGRAKEADIFNWTQKVAVAAKKVKYLFDEYEGGYSAFVSDFERFFLDHRRFTYTPLMLCKGIRPFAD
ncbi:MAG: methyltransferase type 11 [Deltaproteobacteria bacterium HGW-Deltaproteobacteria-10]|nr:MAG: methyltransferase type 11 [Deltaproteobacteria bacterium HGW-Deltaproteobacteria-10]